MKNAIQSRSTQAVFGAWADTGELTGIVGVYRYPKEKEDHKAGIWGMYVDRLYRKQGYGRKNMNPKTKFFIAGLIVILLFSVFLEYVYVPASNKGIMAREASTIFENVISNYNFTVESKSMPGRPAFGWTPGMRGLIRTTPHIMSTYGIVEAQEQNTIADIINKFKMSYNSNPVIIKFYKEENWQVRVGKDGKSRGGSRGPEELIREIKID